MGIGTFVLAAGFKALTGDSATASSLWLANGFALAMLLTAPRSRWPLLLIACTLAGAGGAFYLHAATTAITRVALSNTLEVLVAAVALTGTVRTATDLAVRANFLRFLGVAVLLAPAVLTLALVAADLIIGRSFEVGSAQRILIGHALGMAIMTPVMLALRNGELRQYLRPSTIAESLLTLILVATVSAVVFSQDLLPLLFLIFPPMILVAYRGGFVGTAVALLVVVTIGTVATAAGYGPIAGVQNSGRRMATSCCRSSSPRCWCRCFR
jgi:integral membrane sensor domain MASE1